MTPDLSWSRPDSFRKIRGGPHSGKEQIGIAVPVEIRKHRAIDESESLPSLEAW